MAEPGEPERAERETDETAAETQLAAGPTPTASRRRRGRFERQLLRIVAVVGIIGIGIAIGAIMRSQQSAGWLIGLVVALVTLALIAIVQWSTRRL